MLDSHQNHLEPVGKYFKLRADVFPMFLSFLCMSFVPWNSYKALSLTTDLFTDMYNAVWMLP